MHKWQVMDLPHFAELVLQAEQVGLKDACRKADEQRSKMQLDTEALELRLAHLHPQPSAKVLCPSHILAVLESCHKQACHSLHRQPGLLANVRTDLTEPAKISFLLIEFFCNCC